MQQSEMIVHDADAARALLNTPYLDRFVDPASPSDVARDLGLPANLVHHHARRALDLGLLFEARREGGKVYYQLAARTFRHDRHLLPPGDPDERMTSTLRALQDRFLAEYERSDLTARGEDPEWTVYGFPTAAVLPGTDEPPAPGRLAHFSARTLRLTPERYARLVRTLARLLAEEETERGEGAGVCTLALLAFDGALRPGGEDGRSVSSWVSPV